MFNPFIVLFLPVIGATLYENVKPLPEMNYETFITSVIRKVMALQNEIHSRESQEAVREVKGELTARMEDMREEFITRNEKLNERMNEMYAETKTRQDNITAKLEELIQLTLEQKEDTDEKQSEMEIKVEKISKRLQKETDRFLVMNNHLSHELLQVQKKGDEVSEKIRSVEDEVKSSLEMGRSKMEKLELKGNFTRFLVVSHMTSQLDEGEAIRQNASASEELLRQHGNESVLGLENGQSVDERKMSDLASLITNLEKVNGKVSELDESLQSIGNEVKQLEQRGDLRSAETSEMQKTLKNHTSEIGAMNSQLFDILNGCSDPPPIANGYPVVGDERRLGWKHGASATYACEAGRTLVGSGDLVCRLEKWTGVLPRCAKNCITEDLKKEYDVLDIPTNTTVEHSKTVDVRCRKGYVVSSSSASPTCNDGTWNVTADPCIGDFNLSCDDDPPSLQNGKAADFERWHGSRVLYECERNFVMTGNSSVRCELGQWNGYPPVCSDIGDTFYAEYYRGTYTFYIDCHSDVNAEKIQFSRVIDSGTGGGLPMGTRLRTSEKSARMDITGSYWSGKLGAYRCGFETEGYPYVDVPFQSAYFHFPDPSLVASVGDNVTLSLRSFPGSRTASNDIVWRHDGEILTESEGWSEFHIGQVDKEHQGLYSARNEDDTFDEAFVFLSVRKCKANVFGESCDQECPTCYNGGICHDILGTCVCPEGFVGRNCETPCPPGFHGADCSTSCGDGECKFRLFCKPPPFGCACSPGYKAPWCYLNCDEGWYGASCKQPCHCAEGGDCNRFTGACSGGCAPGWKGLSCHIRDDELNGLPNEAVTTSSEEIFSTEESV